MISDVRSVRVGHLETLSQCVAQNCLKVPQVCLNVPRKFLKVPPLFSGTYFTATSNISQLQASATGICSIQILILVRSTLFSGRPYLIWRLKVPQVVSQGARVRGTLRHFLQICFVKKCKVTHF